MNSQKENAAAGKARGVPNSDQLDGKIGSEISPAIPTSKADSATAARSALYARHADVKRSPWLGRRRGFYPRVWIDFQLEGRGRDMHDVHRVVLAFSRPDRLIWDPYVRLDDARLRKNHLIETFCSREGA